MPWIDEADWKTVDDLLGRLLTLSKSYPTVACRGQADSSWPLQASLDRILDAGTDYISRLAEERAIVEKFRVRTDQYLGRIERQYVTGNRGNDMIAALAVLQHYHTPTRLLDWTHSPWVALYFAAINHADKPGAVWWFNQKAFEHEVHRRWRKEEYDMDQYRRAEPNGQVNLNSTAFSIDGPPWITGLHYPVPFHRIEVQQGFFTVAGRLGLEHGERIADVFDRADTSGAMTETTTQYARVIVPASWKQAVLDRLRAMNIHSKSLDYPGADLVGIDLTESLRRSAGH